MKYLIFLWSLTCACCLHGDSFSLDLEEQKVLQVMSPRTLQRIQKKESLTISDIIKLCQSGVPDRRVIEYIRLTHSTYPLTRMQERRLIENGVSQTVLSAMERRS